MLYYDIQVSVSFSDFSIYFCFAPSLYNCNLVFANALILKNLSVNWGVETGVGKNSNCNVHVEAGFVDFCSMVLLHLLLNIYQIFPPQYLGKKKPTRKSTPFNVLNPEPSAVLDDGE